MRKSALLLFMFMLFNTISAGNWPGNAIVGNGRFCAVYSEDARVTAKDRSRGIRHFYWNDFTADYISSEASPLTWGCSEFAGALRLFATKTD